MKNATHGLFESRSEEFSEIVHKIAEEQQRFRQTAACESLKGFFRSKPVYRDELISMIDKGALLLETPEEGDYWEQIGRLNFLSPRPLEEYLDVESYGILPVRETDTAGSAIALVECSQDQIKHIYVSDSYLRRIKELGFENISAVEFEFNNHRSEQ